MPLPDPLLAQLQQVDVETVAVTTAQLVERTYVEASEYAEQHVPRIGLLITTSLMALYGGRITQAVRSVTLNWPFPLRAGLFIVVVGMGFAALLATVAPVLTALLEKVPRYHVIPATLVAFTLVGILAERNERI